MTDLASKTCLPCQGGVEPMKGDDLLLYLEQVHEDWHLVNEHHLEREYWFKDFKDALAFANSVGDLAESVNHHPDIHLSWGKVVLHLWTHKIDGLSESDFIFAAKVDRLR